MGLILRAASMLGKLALVLYFSKYGTFDDLGVYGLFLSSVGLLNYLQGLEFNTYTAREIVNQDRIKAARMVTDQTFVHLLTYGIAMPLSLLVFVGGFLSWEYLLYFLWIAIFTHLGQEVSRLLIIFASTTEAYIVSFLIHGLWACIAIVVFLIEPDYATLDTIFILWGAFSVVGLTSGIFFLKKTRRFGRVSFNIDWAWIKRGLQVCHKFFIGVMAIKMIELSDRFFIKYFHSESLVGVYTFYGSVANIVQEFVYTGAIVLLIPKLLTSYKEKNSNMYEASLRELKSKVWKFSFVIVVLIITMMSLLIPYLERDLLSQNYNSFLLLVISSFIFNVSLVPHYKLYMAAQDSALMWSALVGVVLNIFLNYFLIPSNGALGAAVATIISFSSMFACKALFVQKLKLINFHE